MTQKVMTGEEYKQSYVPVGSWVLIEKDILPEKTKGGIVIPTSSREKETRVTMSGIIIAKSPFRKFENEWEEYLHAVYQVGDRVGFSDTTPLLSPAPPDTTLAEDCNMKYVTMHITDILVVFCETEEARKEFFGRFYG